MLPFLFGDSISDYTFIIPGNLDERCPTVIDVLTLYLVKVILDFFSDGRFIVLYYFINS